VNSLVLKAVVAVCAVTWIGLLAYKGTVQPSADLWAPFGTVVSIAGVLVWVFDKWLWSWRIFGWFVKRPDLRGTWLGEIVSEWVNPETGRTPPPIPAFVSVTQTASALYLRQFTAESESSTVAARLLKEEDDADFLVVVYRNDPQALVRARSPIHFGGMRLRVTGNDALAGDYWTDRKTSGTLTIKRVSRSKCRSFADAQRIVARPS
jgi:hypothetical protein